MKRHNTELIDKSIDHNSTVGINEVTTTVVKAFESKSDFYECKTCGSLPVCKFSKTKINQYDRLKITIITCTDCTTNLVSIDEKDKTGAKKQRIQEAKDANQKGNEIINSKKSDPSALYDKNVLDAPIISDAKEYFGNRSLDFKIYLGRTTGYRTIAKLAVRAELIKEKNGLKKGIGIDEGYTKVITSIGLFQPGTHKVIKCLESDAHHPSINICVNAVQNACNSLDIHGYIEGSGSEASESFKYKTYLKYIIMAVERETNKIQLSIVWNTKPTGNADGDDYLQKLVTQLSEEIMIDYNKANETLLFHSIWVNFNPSSRYHNAITCHDNDAWTLLFGKSQIKERLKTDMKHPPKLRFPPLVFRQANIDAFGNIIQNIRNWIKEFISNGTSINNATIKEDRKDEGINDNIDGSIIEIKELPVINCVELYGGVGTIGLNCLDLLKSLHCSDENPHNKV
jgi:tRNA/tmRNA/rRNA uracil-C5-methylase (TrmA/RlmC/RlmD family)